MKDAAETLMNHEREILHYFHERLTNAVCEGINSMIQAAKRKASGYNTFEGFAGVYPEFCVNVLRECKHQKLV